ncbi:MAG: TRIC cation channel family protein [Rhizobiaceae bacterium]
MSFLTDLAAFAPLITMLTVVATAVMAASAAVQGVRQDFDPFGTTVLAIVTAVGGGSLRDLLIGSFPVFWLQDMTYLATAIPIALLTYLLGQGLKKGNGRRLRLLLYLDAIGLALFTLVGLQTALANDLSFTSAIVLGCITGVAGGMFRDLLCGLQPSILKQDLYATISLLGGVLYLLANQWVEQETSLILSFIFMTLLRFFVVYRSGLRQNENES